MAMKTIAILSAAALLGACASSSSTVASLTPQQCDANWAAVGQADGLDGARAGKLLGYRTACARGGAPMSAVDEATWRDGWRKGVAALCAADEADLDVRQANARGNLCGVDLASVEDGVTLRDHDHNHGHSHNHGHGSHHHHHERYGYHGPRIFPTFGFGVGFGSRGTRFGSRFGIGVGFPLYHRRHYY